MTDENFIKFLKDDSWKLSPQEVEQLMNEELEKDAKEINVDFVDACLNYLTGGKPAKTKPDRELADRIIKENSISKNKSSVNIEVMKKPKQKRFRLNPLLIAAIIAVLLSAAGVTACAAYVPSFKDAVVNFFADHASINYSAKNTVGKSASPTNETKLYKELKDGGIKNIVLPSELFKMKHTKLNWQNDDFQKSVNFISNDKNISVTIKTFTDKKWIMNTDIQGNFTTADKVNINGTDVYLFEQNGKDEKNATTSVSYQIGLTQYFIQCNYNIQKAKELFKSMN